MARRAFSRTPRAARAPAGLKAPRELTRPAPSACSDRRGFPQAHGAQELLKQIQEAEKAANARIRQERIFTAIGLRAPLTATVAIAAEVGAAPMNPHADPGKALGHAATAINTVGLGVGQHLRQKVHERTKADSDIRAAIETYTREQRSNAEIWAEKLSNQMDHLDHLIPPVAELDRLERSVGALQDPGPFIAFYQQMRDHNAYDIHMAAANEMVLSDNPELQQAGLQVAQSLRGNESLQGASWKDLQTHVAELSNRSNARSIGGPLLGPTSPT